MKKFILWTLAFVIWAVPALAAETNLMTHTEGERLYIIKFVYDPAVYMRPAIHPPGPPHYDATITVSVVDSNELIQVCPSWRGYYTARKCYEDEPATLIRQAFGRRRKRSAGDTEQPLSVVAMRKFGFALRDNGKEWTWERMVHGVVVRFVQIPTLSRLFGEIFEVGAKKALREQRARIREALLLEDS